MAPYCQWMGLTSDLVPLQRAVAAHERLAAQIEPFVEQLPKLLLVSLRHDADLRQVDGHDALIEASLEFITARFRLSRGKGRSGSPWELNTLPS